ncbi:MAG: hypothetical protein ACLQME_19530 [Alphaproteobacteria bacterium]
MSEHKPQKKAQEIVSPAAKTKPGERKVGKGELDEKALEEVSGGTPPDPCIKIS